MYTRERSGEEPRASMTSASSNPAPYGSPQAYIHDLLSASLSTLLKSTAAFRSRTCSGPHTGKPAFFWKTRWEHNWEGGKYCFYRVYWLAMWFSNPAALIFAFPRFYLLFAFLIIRLCGLSIFFLYLCFCGTCPKLRPKFQWLFSTARVCFHIPNSRRSRIYNQSWTFPWEISDLSMQICGWKANIYRFFLASESSLVFRRIRVHSSE
jgi:hypothetical protein